MNYELTIAESGDKLLCTRHRKYHIKFVAIIKNIFYKIYYE